MELHYQALEYYAVGALVDCTEVTFNSYEKVTRRQLIENLPKSGIPYDKEVFPEQIILGIHATARQIHSVITGKGSVAETQNRVKISQTQLGRPIETIQFPGDDNDPL